MASSESQTGGSASNIVPVVVVLCNMQVARVFSSIIVTVSDKRSLPVVMKISVGDCDPF